MTLFTSRNSTLSNARNSIGQGEAGLNQSMTTRQAWRSSAQQYAVAAVACAVFSAIYESLSHGVWSAWMVCLCLYPLVLGVVPAFACWYLDLRVPLLSRDLWACGVMTLAMGSCLQGVVEIYGTTSPLVLPYLPLGAGLLLASVVAAALRD